MPARRNPFRPTAGATPPILVGRHGLLEQYAESIDDGPGAPWLLTLVTGARGVGKTVMLTELGDVARAKGWVVIDETATRGVMERIAAQADRHRSELGSPDRARVVGGSIGSVISIDLDTPERPVKSWRQRVGALLDVLAEHETGLVVTIDEIHGMDTGELAELAACVQHLIRDGRAISLVMAGLPSAVNDLLNGDVSTFLRRAERMQLDNVPLRMIADSLKEIFEDGGLRISEEDLAEAVAATQGYPFMIQLVGYHLWRRADDQGRLDHEAVTEGIEAARQRLGTMVIAAALADLSRMDRTVLSAMASKDGPSRTADIARAIGRDSKYVGVYRARLMAAGMIRSAGHGQVDFAMPYLREYLAGLVGLAD